MNKIDRLVAKMSKAREQLAAMEAEYEELRLENLRKVTMVKVGKTTTLTFKNRVIKVTPVRNDTRGLNIMENGRMLVNEYRGGGIHDIRFMLAIGKI
jgi:hypothetical protein